MLRKSVLPVLLALIVIGATWQAVKTNDEANPDAPPPSVPTPALATPLFSTRRAPAWLAEPTNDRALEDRVAAMVRDWELAEDTDACVAVVREGELLAAHRPDALLVPGSTQKIFTALAALDVVGSSATFTTQAALDSSEQAVDGIYPGNLSLIGGGDPQLMTPDFAALYGRPPAVTDLAELADATAARLTELGIVEVAGGIIADDRRYEPPEPSYLGQTDADGAIWPADVVSQGPVGTLGPLIVNHGLSAWPLDGAGNFVAAEDPALEAAQLLSDLLNERGIVTNGVAPPSDDPAALDAHNTVVAEVKSAAVAQIVSAMIRHQQHTVAELLLKEIGVQSSASHLRGVATLATAVALDGQGLDLLSGEVTLDNEPAPVRVRDGSGLSPANRSTCELLANASALLAADHLAVFEQVTATTDTDVDLCKVASTTSGTSLVSAVRPGIAGIYGRRQTDGGEVLDVALLVNARDDWLSANCQRLFDDLIATIEGHPYSVDPADLEPLNVQPPASDG